jgi:Delta7-sterol 5-desaturase
MFMLEILLRVLVFSSAIKLLAVSLGFLLLLTQASKRWVVYRLPWVKHQLQRELFPALIVVLVDALLLTLFRSYFAERLQAFQWSAFLLSYLWMYITFEVWFYVTHRLLHTKALYPLHAQHHVAKVTEPLTSLSFSISERIILIGGALGFVLLGSYLFSITQAGLFAYLLTNYALNILGHSNTEWFPSWFLKSPLGKIFLTPTFHAMHHARYQGNYGLFTTVLDRWCSTSFADYEAVHQLAREGRGLHRLVERAGIASGSTTESQPSLLPSGEPAPTRS